MHVGVNFGHNILGTRVDVQVSVTGYKNYLL